MSAFERTSAALSDHQGEDIDALLRGFFASEMLRPWPEFEQPGRTLKFPGGRSESSAVRSRWPARSRLVLAASVALFFAAQFFLPSFIPSANKVHSTSSSPPHDPTADTRYNKEIIRNSVDLIFDGEETVIRSEAEAVPGPGK